MIKINCIDDPVNIKICQFLFYSMFIYFIDIEYFFNFNSYPDVLYLPQGIFSYFKTPLKISYYWVVFLKYIWLTAGIFCACNLFYKKSSVVFFIITFLGFNISYNYGYQPHLYLPIILVSFIMAFGKKNRIFLAQFIFCSIFFMAGLSKLRNSGVSWIYSDSLQNMLIRSNIYYSDINLGVQKFNVNIYLAKNIILTQVIAFSVIFIELMSPLAIFKTKFSKSIIVLLMIMQIGIYFTMFVYFKFYILMYVFWIDWRNLLYFIASKVRLRLKSRIR